MKKIRVPTDFSKDASYALEVANEIAKQHDFAQVRLTYKSIVAEIAKKG